MWRWDAEKKTWVPKAGLGKVMPAVRFGSETQVQNAKKLTSFTLSKDQALGLMPPIVVNLIAAS